MDRRRAERDRRQGPRVRMIAAVRERHPPRLYLSQDLGPRGMALLRPAGEALPVRMPLTLEFDLPGGRRVRALARVTHDTPGGRFRRTGLEFMQVEIAGG